MMPRRGLEEYLEAFLRAASPRSCSAAFETLAALGMIPNSNGLNQAEDGLLRLVDRFPGARLLSREDIRTLIAYQCFVGGTHQVVGQGGEIIDNWASGIDHAQAAKILGIGGRNPAVTARKRYCRILEKLGAQ